MNSLRQSLHDSDFSETKTFHFAEDVPAGDLLLAYVTTSDVVVDSDYWAFLGYAHDPGFPTVTISTPGIEWELLGTAEATVNPYMAVLRTAFREELGQGQVHCSRDLRQSIERGDGVAVLHSGEVAA